MKFLSTATGSEWAACAFKDGADDAAQVKARDDSQKLDQSLVEVLLSENLVVLAGLGTTLCLNKAGEPKVAPEMPDLWDAAGAKAGARFDRVKKAISYTAPPGEKNIEALLSRCQLSEALKPTALVERFIAETEAVIVEQCRFVVDTTDLSIHESFLRKVARRPTRLPRTRLFTTNYDLCFETAASHARFTVVDGFSHTQPQEFDGTYFGYDLVRREQDRDVADYIPNVFHLHKMHGSVDWELRGSQIIKMPRPKTPLIIYPRHSKFEASYDQPFIEMMSRFQSGLRQPNTGLLIVGFGFNDPHIWQPIMSAVRSNVSLKAIVIDPALPSPGKEPLKRLENLIRAGDARLGMVSCGFEDVVSRLPDLVAATEEERHRSRVRPAEKAR